MPGRSPESIAAWLEMNLYKFDGPGQMLGTEPNTARRPWDGARVRWLLAASWDYSQAAGNMALPALYDAMFTLTSEMPFASPDSPQPLKDGFGEFFITVGSLVPESEAGTYTETFWAALHGLITLERSRRLPPAHRAARIALLVDSFAAPRSGRAVR